MAPTKSKTGSKGPSKGKTGSSKHAPSSRPKKPTSTQRAVQQKTKSAPRKTPKKKRVYTEKELGIPALNSITPAGVQKPKGMKKGKKFVDDKESMLAILAMVQAEKEGNIESKMMKARHMEEIREARRVEAEKKEAGRKQKLEEVKDELRKGKKRRSGDAKTQPVDGSSRLKPKKKVSFG